MSFTYYASCIPGLQHTAERLVTSRLGDAVVIRSLEGALVFQTGCSYDRLNLFCFNNIFLVLDMRQAGNGEAAIESHMREICRRKKLPLANGPGERSFRIVCSRANQLVGVNENLKRNVEERISRETGLRVNRSKPGREYWFLLRSEGLSLFMERLSRHRSFDKALHPGELPPPLAYLMCWMAAPEKTSLVLDPFCGYGSIPEQGCKHFPLKQFYAFDIKDEVLRFSRTKLKGGTLARCTVQKTGIHDIFSFLDEGTVDRIVTDPPWGLFEKTDIPLGQFYDEMVRIFFRLLKAEGRIVLLTAAKDEFAAAVSKQAGLEITDLTHVLVSGKKAGIFIVKKRPPGPPSTST
jgi:23S rRNA G2445 N2-methylase RlmL